MVLLGGGHEKRFKGSECAGLRGISLAKILGSSGIFSNPTVTALKLIFVFCVL